MLFAGLTYRDHGEICSVEGRTGTKKESIVTNNTILCPEVVDIEPLLQMFTISDISLPLRLR